MEDAAARDMAWTHIIEIATCMMVTHDGQAMRSRPMRGVARPNDNAIWFFTDRDAEKDREAQEQANACLTYADIKNQTFVSVSGPITVVTDPAAIEDLWSVGAEAYFPKGKDDPNIALLKFVPETAEYWDAPSSPILLAIKFLQAHVSKERPDFGENRSVQMG